MIRKLLIANRGEIVLRIAKTARDMGVATVAVYSDADASAAHVLACGEAVHIGGAAPSESYLRGDRIIEAARQTGADAVHPGYGFLSENPEFAEAVEAAGLIFVGPSPEATRAMGLKDAAKALMQSAGVPVVPGYHGEDQSDEALSSAAESVGYPALIKAVAGGGGKGMRRVDKPADFADALRAARSEAQGAFGNAAVLIEKYVTQPRHIEVQVFGDGTRALHLFERDCSLQRRHQKVIEEAPAPGMTEDMRAAMGAAAVRAAEAIGYVGAGTVEFIVDASDGLRPDRFWFMEMNTRLQVEHPVTEAVTGVDLVEWQLRVASGQALPCAQEDITLTGHAFEARLYAEDVPAGFLPATGTLDHLQFPANALTYSGVRRGDSISAHYDPMIAKIIVSGDTRADALGALGAALAQTQVAGLTTNLAFLRALTAHEGFAAGDVDTGLIDRNITSLSAEPTPCSRARAMAAVVALDSDAPQQFQGFSLWTPLNWHVSLDLKDARVQAVVTPEGKAWRVAIEDETHLIGFEDGAWICDGHRTPAQLCKSDAEITVFWGNTYRFERVDPLARAGNLVATDTVLAPMPGLVRDVFASAGAAVEAEEKLALLEAMKMEHVLRAPRAGVLKSVQVSAGDQVEAGQLLIALEPEDADED